MSLQAFQAGNMSGLHEKGYTKIVRACELAKRDKIGYIWIDTCCIDKTSSAELTEAINSMFQWYKESLVCYAWLVDLPAGIPKATLFSDMSPLRNCRWFTRGWTLQELIAPPHVKFYDEAWQFCGTRETLRVQLSQITNIKPDVLQDSENLDAVPVAQKMSWMAGRTTTRPEDSAYCLLGVFRIYMPMMYGEGNNAFLRLQEEIARTSNDTTLFAWKAKRRTQTFSGIFATSLEQFESCGQLEHISTNTFSNPEFTLTNKGLRIETDLYLGTGPNYLLALNCWDAAQGPMTGEELGIGIMLQNHGSSTYARFHGDEYVVVNVESVPRRNFTGKTYICKTVGTAFSASLENSIHHCFKLRSGYNEPDHVYSPDFPWTAIIGPLYSFYEDWDPKRRVFFTQGKSHFIAYVHYTPRYDTGPGMSVDGTDTQSFTLAFGKRATDDKPWVTLLSDPADSDILALKEDPRKMEIEARQVNHRSKRVLNSAGKSSALLTVEVVEEVIDDAIVYCLDLAFEGFPSYYVLGKSALAALPVEEQRKPRKPRNPRKPAKEHSVPNRIRDEDTMPWGNVEGLFS